MASRTIMVFTAIMVLALSTVSLVVAGDRWNSPRDLEPIIIKGETFIDFLQKPIKELYVYAYNATANDWRPIPFQFDQKDDSLHFWVPVPNDTLDPYDELVFMAKDMGDKAPDGSFWIDDADSRNYNRVEITATDSVVGKMGWIYLYRSKNILPLAIDSYVKYKVSPANAIADTILAQNYIEGHNGSGLTDYLICTKAGNIEILDRQKMQIDLIAYLGGIPFALTIREDLLESPNFTSVILKTKVGPVRIIRQVYWHVNIGFGYPPIDFSLPLLYYAFSVESGGISGTLKESNHVNLIRQSFDLNLYATGMKLFNPYNKNGITIDGIGGHEVADSTVLDDPAVNWWMVTGNQGSYAIVFKLSPIGNKRSLYYYDNKKEGEDTGDKMSWGDTGIQIKGTDIAGKISFAYKAYYLGANKPYSLGDSLATNFKNPLQITTQPSYYVPVELAFFKAQESDGKVALEWLTQTESNNYGFEIHRKTSLSETWDVIATLKGQGTTTTPHKYSYTDHDVSSGTYYYQLKQIDFDGAFKFSDEVRIDIDLPNTYSLDQNYPNPSNPETVIRYRIPALDQATVSVELKIYNLLGDEVKTLVHKDQPAGNYSIAWDGKNNQGEAVAAGTYLYRFRAGSFVKTNKMLILR